jgi:hypothetical protein
VRGILSPFPALFYALFAHEVRVIKLVKPFRVRLEEIFPLNDRCDGKQEDRIGPDRRYLDHWRKGHQVSPVVDPAGVATFVLNDRFEGAPDGNAELIHEDKKENDDEYPQVVE